MIRVGLYTQDGTLPSLLSSGLGEDFQFFLESGHAGIRDRFENHGCTVVIVDVGSLDGSPRERVESARRLIAAPHALIVLADDTLRATADELVRGGAFAYCRRPPSLRDLRNVLRRAHDFAVRRQEFDAEIESGEQHPTDPTRLIGNSDAMQCLSRLVDRVADVEASVLINGESGTGKELVARAIHNRGSRASRPFVAVSCGAIPETLIEAELFGHEKGAFTGTVGAREGFFEQAADGTLLLDEIGELSPYTQVKLLRVLQQREFSRLGSNRLIRLRARLIFTTHRDLAQLVAEGKFRQDLYFRINVVKIVTPRLQEHASDVPQIAMHFLRHYGQLFHKRMAGIEAEALTVLQEYHWPGNVRELENVIQRAIVMAPGTMLRSEDLPSDLHGGSPACESDCLPGGAFERQMREYRTKLAENALRDNNGNKALTARSLGISRAYLYRLLRQPGPQPLSVYLES
ncbi:MAG TPA: sigma-54 dependent transcriptional regulator [Terracidiphilus sp.]